MANDNRPVTPTRSQVVLAEFGGSAALLCAVVGSGIMAERLSDGNVAIALLANTMVTGCALVVLIMMMGPISGAHFNPAVTLYAWAERQLTAMDAALYIVMQLLGSVAGVVVASLMFAEPLLVWSTKARGGWPLWLGEAVATFGLLMTIIGVSRSRPTAVPVAVAAYIMAGYWATSSSSFANPAAALARTLTNTFAGIQPADAPGFVVAELVGVVAALAFGRLLFPPQTPSTT